VADIDAAPMLGMTAIGFPEAGTTVNQGRVGLCQNGVSKPGEILNLGLCTDEQGTDAAF
jgi:hypothetical protein